MTLSKTKVGCALGKTMVNHLAYADDLVILSPSVKGLQKLLNICSEYGEEHDIMFNHTKKPECMYFPVKGRAHINIPKVFLNAHLLRWVTKYKYLGFILTDDLSDDCNMLRQRGIYYARSNSIIRTFSLCSPYVKVKLFKAFCCIMYCCQIWSQYKKDTVRKLQLGYNHAFRRIMKYDRTCSSSGMFVANGVMSFNELWRKSLYNFKQRVTKSNNFIVNHVYNIILPEPHHKSGRTLIIYCTFCKYVIVICRSYTSTCYYVLVFFFVHHDVRMYDFCMGLQCLK